MMRVIFGDRQTYQWYPGDGFVLRIGAMVVGPTLQVYRLSDYRLCPPEDSYVSNTGYEQNLLAMFRGPTLITTELA